MFPFGFPPVGGSPAPGPAENSELLEAIRRQQSLVLQLQQQQQQQRLQLLGMPTAVATPMDLFQASRQPMPMYASDPLLQRAREDSLRLQLACMEREQLLEKQLLGLAAGEEVLATPRGMSKIQTVASERSTIKLPSEVKTPQQASQVLAVLGSTLRAKNDAFIDASALPYPKIPPSVRGGVSSFFPDKLYRAVEDAAKNGQEDIVSFLPHGRAFMVHKMDEFVKEILPKYFNGQTKWGSFSRQLNLYGFHRIAAGKDAGAFYHELFLKGHPNLCRYMRRVGAPSGVDRRRFKLPEGEDPDFYAMDEVQPASPEDKKLPAVDKDETTN